MEARAPFLVGLCVFIHMSLPVPCVKTTTLSENVTLTCNLSCLSPREWTNNEHRVIKCSDDDKCIFGEGFEKRAQFSSKTSLDLIISQVRFNDQGSYVGSCDNKYCYHTLEVLAPLNVTTFPGKDVILPCYATTEKVLPNPFVLWEKDGKIVLLLENGKFSYAPMLENTLSVSIDNLKEGDYSLRLTHVRPSDQGLYQCQYSKRREGDQFRGAPNSVRLILEEECRSKEEYILIVFVVGFCVGVAATLLLKKYQDRCSCPTGKKSAPHVQRGNDIAGEDTHNSDITHPIPRHACISPCDSDMHHLSAPLIVN